MRYVMVRAQSQEQEDFDVFFENSVVAVGWSDVDFSQSADANIVAEAVRQFYYADGTTAPTVVGKRLNEIRRFFDLTKDDIVIVPHWSSIVLAKIAGNDLEYRNSGLARHRDLANQRRVEYVRNEDGEVQDVPRKQLTEGLSRRLRMMGSTVTDLSAFSSEIDDLITNRTWDSKYWDLVSAERGRQIQKLQARLGFAGRTNLEAGGEGLEQLVREILEASGYQVEKPSKNSLPVGADIDLEATWTDELGLGVATLLIQVKHQFGEIGSEGGRQLVAAKEYRDIPDETTQLVLVTTGTPSEEADSYCTANSITVIGGDRLCEWIIDNGHKLSEQKQKQLSLSALSMIIDV